MMELSDIKLAVERVVVHLTVVAMDPKQAPTERLRAARILVTLMLETKEP